jgi:hypothetical protein
MSAPSRAPLWFGRVVLGAASLLLLRVGLGYVADPVGSAAPHAMVLGSAEAITNMRVSGGVFVGVALVLVACLVSERRLLAGLAVLATIAAVILGVRLLGLGVDGAAPFTLRVLKPEIALVVLSTAAAWLERRRLAAAAASSRAGATADPLALIPSEGSPR